MHQNSRHIYGRKLQATDGEIGPVADLYFDDASWALLYLVADTGSWLSGRRVLIRPRALEPGGLGEPDRAAPPIRVNRTRRQIEESQSGHSEVPVSRQYEEPCCLYLGGPDYWRDAGTWGVVGSPSVVTADAHDPIPRADMRQPEDAHLRSTRAVTGYHIEATDGGIGIVDSFVVDDSAWLIGGLVVEAGHWYAGRKVVLPPECIRKIEYDVGTVFLNLPRRDLQRLLEDQPAKAGAEVP